MGDGRLGVKRVGDGRIGKKWEMGEKNVREQKMEEIVNYARDQGDWAK